MSKVLLFENTADVQMSLAEEYLRDGNLPDAIKAIRTAYEIEDDPAYFVDMGEAYLQSGLVGPAFESFCEAYARGVDSTQCLFGLSRSAYFMGFDKESGEYFKKIFLKNVPDLGQFSCDVDDLGDEFAQVTGGVENRGFTFVKSDTQKSFDDDMVAMVRENPEKALPYFENVPKSSKLFYEARNNIALIKLILGSFNEALEECREILEHKPNDIFALSTMLATYSALGFQDKALAMAERLDGLAIVDEENIRKVALAMCQAEMHSYAVKYLDKLFIQKYERNVMLLRAIAYYNVGEKGKATSTIRDMKKLFPKEELMLQDVESRMRAGVDKYLPYSVIMMHGETLRHIGESRVLFCAEQEDKDFDFEKFAHSLQDEKNYRLLYWYLTNHAYFCKNDEILILFRLCQTQDERCYELLCEVLRDMNVAEYLKCKCIRVLVCHGYDKEIHLVQGANIRTTKPLYPSNYSEAPDKNKKSLLWADAFAIAYSELFLSYDGFEEDLRDVAEDIYRRLLDKDEKLFNSPFALASVIFKRVKAVGKVTLTGLSKRFGVSAETVKKYEKIIYED